LAGLGDADDDLHDFPRAGIDKHDIVAPDEYLIGQALLTTITSGGRL
jgi:hypothetical protein